MRGDVKKLPKWAQNEIARLECNEADLRARLSTGPEDSDTFADPYSASPRPLGEGTTVLFKLGDRREIRARIEKVGGERVLYLNGGDSLQILPQSSNAVNVRVARFE